MIYDPVAAIARARRLVSQVDTEIVQDVGHLLGMQRPGFVNRRIRAFLAGQTAASQLTRRFEVQPA